MIVLALVLLIIVLVFSVAIVLSNPDVYPLSLFRVLVPVTSAGVFFTGFGAALVTITGILLLRTGLRRSRETRRRLRSTERPPAVAASDHSEAPAERSSPSGSTLDLDPGEDVTTMPVDQRTAARENHDRDEPRT